jgi:predicted RNA-binding Zn ribbon-like protein
MPAYYEIVAGLPLPAQLSGHPALDFCNTWAGWDGNTPGDYLRSYRHLAVWAGFTGLLPEGRVTSLLDVGLDQERGEAMLDRARRFRASLYQVLTNGATGSAWDRVAEEVHAAASTVRLLPADGTFRWEIPEGAGLAAPLCAVAWAAAGLLTSPDRSLIRACPGTGCGWLFIDRKGRRRWCTMAACGNREKARRFTARQRDPA